MWPGLTRIAIDHAVAEPAADAGHVVVVPAPFAWDDVGDFASLAALLPDRGPSASLRVLGDAQDVTTVDAAGVVVAAGGRRVAVVGLDDVVVVDTPDACSSRPARGPRTSRRSSTPSRPRAATDLT